MFLSIANNFALPYAACASMKEQLSQEEKQARKATREVSIPAVYFDRGYLVLTLSRYEEHVNFYSLREMNYQQLSPRTFLDRFRPSDLDPVALALNLLARCAEGSYRVSLRVYRRLAAMATNREDLMKLSERALGREYSRIMGLPKPIVRISGDPEVRAKYVDEMVAKIKTSESPEALAPETESSEPQPKKEGDAPVTAKKKKERKVNGTPRAVTYDKVKTKNPYEEASKKYKAFEIFKEGGDRQDILGKIEKLGVTINTASTWLYLFRQVVLTGRQPDWNKERAKVS